MIKIPNKIKLGLKIFGICVGLVSGINISYASIRTSIPKSSISDTFPTSYQTYIDNMKKIYPNATFKAVYTGLDWSTVLKHESYDVNKRISTIPNSYSDAWKMNGTNTYIDGNFVAASKSAVAYVLDPRNSLYEKEIFQFEGLSYNPNIKVSVIEKVITGTPLVGTYEKKYKNAGKWLDMDMSYAEIINKVGKELGVSSVYIASRMVQETSGNIINNGSINGSNSTYPGVYNFFNIGATPNADGTGSVLNGLKYAKSQGWTTPYLSIYGGVDEIKSSYIKYGQDTVYFQKFDVNNPFGNAVALMAYQYQTNIMAPMSESRISYSAYKKLDMLDTAFTFYIPVYNNMPIDPCPYPAGDNAEFVEDNTKVYLDDNIVNGVDIFNIRSSASSELDNIVYTLKESQEGQGNRSVITRIKKGNGYDWDYVVFTVNGKEIKGYVWKDYVQEYNYNKVDSVLLDNTDITLELDDTYILNATISPSDATYKELKWSSEDNNIAIIENGKVVAKKIGTTFIIVTTVDGEKTAKCKVTVTEKNSEILLDKQNYNILINTTIKPKITLKNIASYEMKIVDETIACIENDYIKALKLGETELVIKGIGIDTEKRVKVTVTDACYILHESMNISNNIVTNINIKTTVGTIKEKIQQTKLTTKLKNSSGKVLEETDNVGTGTTITFFKEDGTVFDELTIKICGDVTGDGLINSADLLKVVKHLKGDTIDKFAADVTKDGIVNSADLLKIVKCLKGTATIDFK